MGIGRVIYLVNRGGIFAVAIEELVEMVKK